MKARRSSSKRCATRWRDKKYEVRSSKFETKQRHTIPVLGIDIGTGGSRALVLDDNAALLASATADHAPFRSPRTAWAEQDPDDWWCACQQAVRAVLSESGIAADAIACVGLSGQMHGAVLLGDDGRVLRPSIIWCDQRTEAECRWLDETIGRSRLLDLTSNPALTNFTLTKLLWVRTHEPDVWRRVRHVLLPKDYVRFRLSGEYAIDVADASGTLMLDVARRCWSHEMLDATEIDSRVLPAVFESPAICARVSPDAAALTGIHAGTPIVAGAGDQAAGAIGMGITRPGAVSATIGTSGVVFAATDRPATDPTGGLHTFLSDRPGEVHRQRSARRSRRAARKVHRCRHAQRPGVPADAAPGPAALNRQGPVFRPARVGTASKAVPCW